MAKFLPAALAGETRTEAVPSPSPEASSTTRQLFEAAGFKVIRMVKEDFWLLHPSDKQEAEIHGSMCMSPRAFNEITKALTVVVTRAETAENDLAKVREELKRLPNS